MQPSPAHETKSDTNHALPTLDATESVANPALPMFDADDLTFYRVHGLALRHVGLQQGIEEYAHGNTRGDAVSLACYGMDPMAVVPDLSLEVCRAFQAKVETFIHTSYTVFHQGDASYNAVAFLLLNRDEDARIPYDFKNYPLGKCGTKAFSPDIIQAMLRSDGYHNEDLNHAALNTLMDLQGALLALKQKAVAAWLEQVADHPLLSAEQALQLSADLRALSGLYAAQTYLSDPIASIVWAIFKSKVAGEDLTQDCIRLSHAVKRPSETAEKGKVPSVIKYSPIDLDALSLPALQETVVHYVDNQNEKGV
jgi:hypothetical protein